MICRTGTGAATLPGLGWTEGGFSAMNHHDLVRGFPEAAEECRRLLDSLPDGLCLVDEAGRIRRHNRRLAELWGGETTGLVGSSLAEFFPAEVRKAVEELCRRVAGGGKEDPLEVAVDGRWLEIRAVPFLALDGRPEGAAVVVIQDISLRRQAQEVLLASEERWRRVSHLVSDYAYAFRVEEDGRLVRDWVAGAFTKITAYGAEEVSALGGWRALVHPEDLPLAEERLRRILAGQPDESVFRIVRKDGEVRWLLDCGYPVVEDGRVVRIYGAARDITEKKILEEERARLQEQLQQSQKLEAVGRLAGGIAHDFNNLLNVVLLAGEAALAQLHPEDPLTVEVEAMVEAARRGALLTRQLLAFSRKQPLEPEVVDLNRLIQHLAVMLRRLMGEDIDIRLALAKDLARVTVDRGQLEQVIMNLASNSRDAMPEGGRFLLETANVELDEAYARRHPGVNPGPHVLLAVTDTGCGMSKEVMARAFEPFFTTKEQGKGTGLGLSMVYGIVKQCGGSVWLYSEPGVGTTVKIYFPATEAPPAEPEETRGDAAPGTRGRGEQILVVEDEESLRKALAKILTRLGYRVTLAANGGEALLLVEEGGLQPDLVLTDVVMPTMGGKELVARLKKSRPDLKALYMSGYTDNAIVHQGVLDPGTPFLQKPFTMETIALRIREVLDRPSPRDPPGSGPVVGGGSPS